jgi:hypothetical protein
VSKGEKKGRSNGEKRRLLYRYFHYFISIRMRRKIQETEKVFIYVDEQWFYRVSFRFILE